MWNKIIKSKDLILKIEKKINEISYSLDNYNDPNCSLFIGQSGVVLFMVYYSRYKQNLNKSEENVQALFDYFLQPNNFNYSYGMAGILHSLYHLENEDFFDFGTNIKDFDYSIFSQFISNEKTLDFLHGSTGVVYSLLEQNIDAKYDYLFDGWIASIEKIKENNIDYLKWKTDFTLLTDDVSKIGYCFGLAHGVPSIIITLLKLYERKKDSKTLEYLDKSVAFLLSNRYEISSDFYFPSQILNDSIIDGNLAWCYGDLGIAMSLFMYGNYFNKEEVLSFAHEIFTKHSSKRDCLIYTVVDASICHGSVGIAHIYARMYNYTNVELYRETAEYWYGITIEKAVYSDGIAGYKQFQGKEKPLVNECGLFEGVAGIGLSMISAISNIEPKWDNTLLLS
jgi:lantibiotic modifying enzyme